MDNMAANLRVLLWKKGFDRRKWLEQVAAWIGGDFRRAGDILRGAKVRRDEQDRLAKGLGVSARDLAGKNYLKVHDVNVLLENLRHLINGLERGKKKSFAAAISVHQTTVSGWLSGKSRPENRNLIAVCRYFGLPAGTDLEAEPLFLSPLPLGESQRKRWLHERIDGMDAAALQDIFSLLARMLAER